MCAVEKRDEVRVGSRVLLLVGNPVNAEVLRAHARGPQRVSTLQEEIVWASRTTLRASVTTLREVGALTGGATGNATYARESGLTAAGSEFLSVADVLETWLARAPEGSIPPDSAMAKSAVKALAGGWSSTLMRALASRPYSLAELDGLIPHVGYPSLGRKLAKMRATRQVTPAPGPGRSTPYLVTDWLRRSIAPICAAGRCEQRHMREVSAPIASLDIEAAFLLVLPLASLPPAVSGTCMLAVHNSTAGKPAKSPLGNLSAVTVEVERGEIVSCAARIEESPPTWALGTPKTWLDAVIDARVDALRIGGASPGLARALVSGVHLALFAE
jgi:DNA-binding HxlR family transcriptional regulator